MTPATSSTEFSGARRQMTSSRCRPSVRASKRSGYGTTLGRFVRHYTARLADAVIRLACLPEEDAGDIETGYGHRQAAPGAGDEGTEMKKKAVDRYDSVWDALADTPEQAANLRARTELMQKIAAIVKEQGWTQVEAARRCCVTQPRMS